MRSATDLAARADEYVRLALAAERDEAIRLVLDAIEQGASLAEAYDELLAVACARVGELWHRGDIGVAEEHYTTRLAQEVMARARDTAGTASRRPERIVLACAPEEQHEIGLRMLADVLDAAGWDVHLLGAMTPARDLVAYAERIGASAVALSCSSALAIPSLVAVCESLRAGLPRVRLLLGGRAAARYERLAAAAGADAVCVRLGDAPAALEELLAA